MKEKEPRVKKERKKARESYKRKKKSGSLKANNKSMHIIVLIVILLVIVVLLFLFKGFSLGTGGKGDLQVRAGEGGQNTMLELTGSGEFSEGVEKQKTDVQTEIETESKVTECETKPEPTVISVCVYHSDYIYHSERIDLKKLVDIIRATEGDVIVEIVDDAASSDAYENLIKTLTKEQILFIEKL